MALGPVILNAIMTALFFVCNFNAIKRSVGAKAFLKKYTLFPDTNEMDYMIIFTGLGISLGALLGIALCSLI
jgi:hypothetical protein